MSVLVGRKAPDFTAPAVLKNGEIVDAFHFANETEGKYALIFFYPLDFTFVCPSELIALDKRMKEFESRNVEVMAVSIDSHFSHNAYRNTAVESGGIGPVNFSMIADINHNIAKAYDVEHPEAGVSFRGAFIIDNKGMVRSQIINDLPIGRDVDELLRIIDAVQYTDEHGEVCPAGWRKGKAAMTPSPDGVKEFLSSKTDEL